MWHRLTVSTTSNLPTLVYMQSTLPLPKQIFSLPFWWKIHHQKYLFVLSESRNQVFELLSFAISWANPTSLHNSSLLSLCSACSTPKKHAETLSTGLKSTQPAQGCLYTSWGWMGWILQDLELGGGVHPADTSQAGATRSIARAECKSWYVGKKNHKPSPATVIMVHLQEGLHIWEETACG